MRERRKSKVPSGSTTENINNKEDLSNDAYTSENGIDTSNTAAEGDETFKGKGKSKGKGKGKQKATGRVPRCKYCNKTEKATANNMPEWIACDMDTCNAWFLCAA